MKKNKSSIITSIISYSLLLSAWLVAIIIFAIVSFDGPATDDILIWYESRFGNLSFTFSAVTVIIFLTCSIIYILVSQENKLSRRRR